ncbi:MAG: hypothetical protein FJX67_11035 [Alphaproteobacteria bacterium]|nr:hypothetical protein [Alphaproteobacteria bacterium]
MRNALASNHAHAHRHRPVVQAAAVALAVLVAACAGATPYQAARGGGQGFSEERIAPDRFRVAFLGNTLTDRATVEDYMLRRAAEITLAEGKERFVVIDRDVIELTSQQAIFEGPAGRSTIGEGGRPLDREFHGHARTVKRYRAVAIVAIYGRDGTVPDGERSFEARAILARHARAGSS